jgi:hypothetical protein
MIKPRHRRRASSPPSFFCDEQHKQHQQQLLLQQQRPSSYSRAQSLSSLPRPKRRVRFPSIHSMEQVLPIPPISDYDASEVLAMWGPKEEIERRTQQLRQEARDYFRGMMQEEDDHDDCHDEKDPKAAGETTRFTSLGLTDMFGPGKVEKVEAQEAAWQAVFWEQARQWDQIVNGEYEQYNYDALAAVYQETTRLAQEKAQWQASVLEREVWGGKSAVVPRSRQ